jgi:hypothetical protein
MGQLIYRLVNWDDLYTKRLISHNELYFYSAKEWEKDGEYDFELGDFTVEKITDFIVEAAAEMHNQDPDNYIRWINVHANEFGVDLASLSPAELDLVDQHLAFKIAEIKQANPSKYISAQKNVFFERTGIASLTKTKDSIDLWNFKRGTGSNNVVCIGLDEKMLRDTVAKVSNCMINEVKYSDILHKYEIAFDKTGHKTTLNLIKISFRIRKTFQDENEVRIQRLLIDNSQTSVERTISLPNNIFKEIIILEDADKSVQEEIFQLAKDKGISKIQTAKLDTPNLKVILKDI